MLHLLISDISSACLSGLGKAWDFLCRADKLIPLIILATSIVGVAGIYSSGSSRGSEEWLSQIAFLVAGAIVYIVVAAIPYKLYSDWSGWLYILGIALLVPIAICAVANRDLGGLIHSVNGSRRWYFLGTLGIQPSEFAKIATVVMLARLLSLRPLGSFLSSWRTVARAIGVVALPCALIVVQPDLGSSLVYIPMLLTMLFLAGLATKFFWVIGIVGTLLVSIVAVDIYFYRERIISYYVSQDERPSDPARDIRGQYQAVSWLPLKDYQRDRLLSFVDPEAIDPKGIGSSWNVRQALISVGKGGLDGAGFNKGTQAKLGYLPKLAAHNDFLFSVVAEEYGFVGCAGLVLLYLLMLFRALQISFRARDSFGALLAAGIAMIVMVHVLINIGMNIGLMPVTGLSLPFMSYGGSFVLSCFILLGLLQSVHCHTPRPGERSGVPAPEVMNSSLTSGYRLEKQTR
ncbi:MAG: rod shape-determining protein RodA [Opitutae bacterium]|nr:rod shape-determining protein RodA [Opitutae bacterium]